MRLVGWIVKKRHYAYVMALLLAGGLLFGNSGLQEQRISAQAANSMYLTPASGNYAIGDTITVSIRENSAEAVNAVQAELRFSPNLEFVAINGAGSAFSIDASSFGGNGSATISRGTTGSVTGDQLVSKISFKVVTAGAGTVEVLDGSQVVSFANTQGILSVRNGSSYTLQAGSAATSSAPPSAPPAGRSAPSGATAASVAKASAKPLVTIASQGSSQTTPLPGDSVVELEAPVTIETTTDDNRPVEKVEYLLNGKIVSTDTTPPYSHSIDTDSMRNGRYTLLTNTYYKDGKMDSSEASLVVSNAFGVKQFWLQLRHYAWLVIILVIVAGELVYLRFFKGKSNGQNQPPVLPGSTTIKPPNNSGHGTVVVGSGSSSY